MTIGTFLRHLRRDARGSGARLVFFVLSLAVGVAGVVAVAGFSDALDTSIRGESRQLLAADLAVRGRAPIPEDFHRALDQVSGSTYVNVREMLTIVAASARGDGPGASQLVELKATSSGYPFYGTLELTPARPLESLLGDDGTVVAPELLSRLGLSVGETLKIGGIGFTIRGTVAREPDRIATAMSAGPRVFVSTEGLERSGLVQQGSRITHRVLIKVPTTDDASLEALAETLRAGLPEDGRFRLETYRDAQPAMRQGLRRTERFLGLAALLSLVIGGIGIAQTVRAWLAARLDAIAILKCLGYRPREVLWLYLGQAAALGIAGSMIGAAGGLALQQVPAQLLQDILPVDALPLWQPAAVARGIGLGVATALLFSLPPLLAARRVPPVRVLRRDTQPLPSSKLVRAATGLALVSGVFALATWQAGSLVYAAFFTGGLIAATALLAAAAWLLTRLAVRPRKRARLVVRHGLAALARPGAGTQGAVVALGLGVLVLVGMLLVERRLDGELTGALPADAPTAFLVDIQPDQWPGVEAVLVQGEASEIDSVPVVMGRITAVGDRDVEELIAEQPDRDSDRESPDDENRRWALTREQRITYLDTLPDDNTITAGMLWHDPDQDELSLEREFAAFLGAELGSVVTLDIQGIPLELTVTSLREVDWSSFGINFFLVAEPGVLDDAPQHRIAAAKLPPSTEQPTQDRLAADFPNVTLIRVREVLERVAGVLERLALGVRVLGLLTVFAGLAILAGAIGATAGSRGGEVALYKTLGMTRKQVITTYATEYALLGTVAGVLGTLAGSVLAYFVLTRGMEIDWQLDGWVIGLAPIATIVLSVVAGLTASARPLAKRPIEALRANAG